MPIGQWAKRGLVMQDTGRDEPRGVALAVTAYLLWGVAPIYMKLMAHVPAVEFVAHRVLWSLPVVLE